MPSATRPISLLTALLMAWTAIWCCCLPPAQAASAAPVSASCCAVETGDAKAEPDASHCPRQHRDGCPVLQLRESSTLPQPAVVPMTAVDFALLPAWLTPLPTPAIEPIYARRSETADPSPPVRTLLALHTSLLW
ncbi:MAG TPA: hypothetical protein VF595_09780 [Tepidisphaeraceae bacterium]|jgi:hypothetical protein